MAERTRYEASEVAFNKLPLPSEHPHDRITIVVPAIDPPSVVRFTPQYDPNARIKFYEFIYRKHYIRGLCVGWEEEKDAYEDPE